MNRLKVLCHFLLLTSSASFQLYTLKSVPDEPSYIVVNHKEPFSIECKAQTLDDFHPAWFFTRDEWDRDPMDESLVQKGYDTESNGFFFTNLTFESVQLDDYGFYECISDQGRVLKSFQLYVNSESHLVLPVDRSRTIIFADAGSSVQIPCRLLNPSNQDITLKLVSSSTGNELPNVFQRSPESGFEIINARLPEHNGEIECQAFDIKNGKNDSIRFTLRINSAGIGSVDNDINVGPPPDCKECYELQKPTLLVENGHDVHAGDSVTLKCSLVIPKALESQVTLKWLTSHLNSDNQSPRSVNLPNGYMELILTNFIPRIQRGDSFKCQSSLKDENEILLEMRTSDETKFNVVEFTSDNHAIEWRKDAFNEVIFVEEGQPVRWVIGFTIHRKDRQALKNIPTLEFNRLHGVSLFEIDIKRVQDHGQNRFSLTLSLDHVDVTDMGQYQLRIYDDEDGSIFEPSLDMFLFVQGKPRVSFQGQHPQGYYLPGEKLNIDCHVLSYPMNETRIEVTFQNCTSYDWRQECNVASSSLSDESFVDQKSVGRAKNDSLSIIINNGYSGARSFQDSVGTQSGFLICEACRNKFECSKSSTPIIVTDLPTENGTFLAKSTDSVVEGDSFSLVCAASKFTYEKLTWSHDQHKDLRSDASVRIAYWESDFSIWTNISIEESSRAQHAGSFYCNAQRFIS